MFHPSVDATLPKAARYEALLPQVKALLEGESDLTANLANVSAVLRETFGWWWVGFYLVKNDNLVLGPFQGPVACTRIAFGKGVCGTAWSTQSVQVVPDVELFPGHIACSAASRSEIVVPMFNKEKEVWAVLDADSEHLNHFDEMDANYLQQLVSLIAPPSKAL